MIIYKCDICNTQYEDQVNVDTIGLATRPIDVCFVCKHKIKIDYRNRIKEFDNNYIEDLKEKSKNFQKN